MMQVLNMTMLSRSLMEKGIDPLDFFEKAVMQSAEQQRLVGSI